MKLTKKELRLLISIIKIYITSAGAYVDEQEMANVELIKSLLEQELSGAKGKD